jgi:predicted nucleic acid-binding protein
VTIVDTSIWIDLFNGVHSDHTAWMNRNLDDSRIALTDLTLCEVLQGLRNDAMHAGVRKDLLKFGVHSTCGTELALATSDNYRFLRKRGITIRKTIDCMIATYCISKGHSLLHNDRDFDPFEQHLGLQVIHP